MAKSPRTVVEPPNAAVNQESRFLPPTRYRHPGDVIRLIVAEVVLIGAAAVTVATHSTYAGAAALTVNAAVSSTLLGQVLAGLSGGLFAVAAVTVVAVTLRRRRFRLRIGLAMATVLAGGLLAGVIYLARGERPHALTASGGHWSWLTGASMPGPALGAAAVAGLVAAAPWLTRPWRRMAWATLWLISLVRLITGTASPVEVVLAFAAGITVGAGVLVLLGAPDRRIGPQGIAAALGSAGLPVARVDQAPVEAKGSRPFFAVAADGEPLFIKVLGSDQRDADLLHRAYRFIRIRGVGDTRPAASLIQAVEHQALVAVMAERAGVTVPAVRQVIKSTDGSALLAMERVVGSSLDQIPAQRISETTLGRVWKEVDKLHRARIAHRSMRAANIVVDRDCQPWLVDFSFSELAATQRQIALDVAAAGHRLVGGDLSGKCCRAHGCGAAADPVLANGAGPGRIVVCEPRFPSQRRRHGAERQVFAEIGRRGQRWYRRRRGEQPGRQHRPSDLDGDLLCLGGSGAGYGLKAAVRQQAAANSRRRRGDPRHCACDPPRAPVRLGQGDPWIAFGRHQT